MNDCAFCTAPDIANVRLIIRNDLVQAFPTNIPITSGHTIICPVRHVEKFEELTSDEREAILELALKIKKALKELFGAEGFHYAWNEGKVAGQSVPHFHLHIVPRKQGNGGITEYEPRKFLYRPGSRETTPEEELRVVAEQIKKAIEC
jgi:diadenosine tetraphosphate (Ap4A) HIT family hydrolase